jgi:hypothetical protein
MKSLLVAIAIELGEEACSVSEMSSAQEFLITRTTAPRRRIQINEMLMEMGLEMCVTTVPAFPTQTRLTLTTILWEMHVTVTLIGTGELVNQWRDRNQFSLLVDL